MKIIGCLTHQHDIRLVLLAGLICGVACFTTFAMLSRAASPRRLVQRVWQAGAGMVFGCGVFATHFVAELAYNPGLPIAYEVRTTLLSLAIACAGSVLAIMLYASRRGWAWRVLGGGMLLGAAIGAMHFTGMAAIRLPGTVVFDRGYIVASLLTGGVLSAVALAVGAEQQRIGRRIAGASALLLAICGLHFVAMAAVTIVPGPAAPTGEAVWSSGPLAIVVATISFAILLFSLAGSVLDQHLALRAARESDRMRQLAEAPFEGILILDGDRILEANQALCDLLGRPQAAVLGTSLPQYTAPRSAWLVRERVRTRERTAAEVELVRADGETIPVEILVRPIEYDGRDAAVVAVRDISERKRAEAQIRYLAHHDALTGLPNRFLFADRLSQALELARRTGSGAAVLCLDLDRFKLVNDVFGHGAGDRLLVAVTERLRQNVRAADTVARLGGDEFAIVQQLAGDPAAAAGLALRIVEHLRQPFDLDGRQAEIGVSIGIASYPGDGQGGPELLKNADTALYRAKHDGRNRFCFFQPEMDSQAQRRRALAEQLRHALRREEMEIYYQPLFSCVSGALEGYEALLRWRHAELGVVPPSEFIPLAEESGVIRSLGAWVLQRACAQAAGWGDPLRVAVNLSPVQFRQGDLPRVVGEVLERTGLPAHRLELEVTEGVLIADSELALATLLALKELGVRVALDDFGTGYSSLGYLLRYPFDKIKIEKSFVTEIERQARARSIVGAVVALGKSLNIEVTAEGVETAAQLEILQAEQCDQVQGFLLGRPAPAHQLDRPTAPAPAAAVRRVQPAEVA